MIAGNLKFTGELKNNLEKIKTRPTEIQIDAADPAVSWMEREGSSSMVNDITLKALEMLQGNSCQVLVMSNANNFYCQALQLKRSASSRRKLIQRDYIKVQNYLHNVILSDSPVLIDPSDQCVTPEDRSLLCINPLENSLLIPMRIETEPVGLFMLGFESKNFSVGSVNQALNFADQACKALHREGIFFEEEVSIVELVMVLAEALHAWDQPTSLHSRRIAVLAEKTAIRLGCSFHEIQSIRRAALLHDIGKMGIPDQILQKPNQLSEREWEIMRRHPIRGANILRTITGLAEVAGLVEAHHEHFDGSGYPHGLIEGGIPLGARILSVADAYTAMVEDRVYRPARSSEEAILELRRCAGQDFDPMVVNAFIDVFLAQQGRVDNNRVKSIL